MQDPKALAQPTSRDGGGREPPGGNTEAAGGEEPPSEFQQRMRRAALASILAHVHGHEAHERPPYVLRPMSLDSAVEYLASDREPRLRVHAAAWLHDNPVRHSLRAAGARPFDSYIRRLLGEGFADGLKEVFSRQPTEAGKSSVRWDGRHARLAADDQGKADTQVLPAGVVRSRYSMAVDWLTHQLGLGCKRRNFAIEVSFDTQTMITSVIASVEVERPADAFSTIADPQNWKRYVPLFFSESDLGTFVGGTFVPGGVVIAPNGTYAGEKLKEQVNLSLNPMFPMAGSNILVASHSRSSARTIGTSACGMRVSLYFSEATTIGASYEKGGIDVDDGGLDAVILNDGWTRLISTKHARFTERVLCGIPLGRWLNWYAPFSLGPWMALLVYEGACFQAGASAAPPV